ncbi:MAG: DUF1800 domain-containing protein [Chitinophagaceae bacterium]|nr:DUF1800 domain-containing protein [Chitinophagaceae bacterium]
MDRREFFTKTKKRTPAFHRTVAAGLSPYAGNWTTNEVAHLLKRTMFGATKQDIDHFIPMSPAAAVDELLNNIPVTGTPLRDYGLIEDEFGVMHDDLGVVQGQTWINDLNTMSDPEVRGSINQLRTGSLLKWWTGLILNQNRSIMEKMVMFWHHHFSVQMEEVGNATMLWRHHKIFRDNPLGSVKQLARDVTIDPAMLFHLNGYLNSKLAPDENYARELQELFTVGRGPGSGYTENDVIAAARVLTGWRIDSVTLTSYLDNNAHDTGSKTFSAFYNGTTIGNNGATEVDQLMDMIFNTTEAARFICRKLYKWFVYYQIDEATENEVIIPLADIMISNNYEVKPVLSALFKSEHFFDLQHQACFIKNPFDIIVGTLREFGAAIPASTDWQNGYAFFDSVYDNAANMQQVLFQPPDVSGWPSYYQEPMYYELWVNSNSLPRRANFTDRLVDDNLIDTRAFANYSSNPADPNQLILDITTLLLRYPLSLQSRNYTKNRFLLNNTNDDTVWTNAWNGGNSAVINAALKELFKFIMNLPEYHLC